MDTNLELNGPPCSNKDLFCLTWLTWPRQVNAWFKLATTTLGRLYERFAGSKVVYYIDISVLLENRPLVIFIRNYIRDPSGVFSISSLVRISMTSFPAFAWLFVQSWIHWSRHEIVHWGGGKCRNTKKKTSYTLKLIKEFLESEDERR